MNELYCLVQTRGIVQDHIFYSGNGKGVIKFSIETKNHDGQKEIIQCIAFGKNANELHQQLQPNSSIHMQGSLKVGKYKKGDQWQETFEIFIKNYKFESNQ